MVVGILISRCIFSSLARAAIVPRPCTAFDSLPQNVLTLLMSLQRMGPAVLQSTDALQLHSTLCFSRYIRYQQLPTSLPVPPSLLSLQRLV